MHSQSLRLGKAKQLHLEDNSLFLKRKRLPQAGLEPVTFCVLGSVYMYMYMYMAIYTCMYMYMYCTCTCIVLYIALLTLGTLAHEQ